MSPREGSERGQRTCQRKCSGSDIKSQEESPFQEKSKKKKNQKLDSILASGESCIRADRATHLSGKGSKAIGDKAEGREERLFPWGGLGRNQGPQLPVKPSNEKSLRGTAEDKRPRQKNPHVSTSITPNPCLVHPQLWQGEQGGEEGEGRVKMIRRETKRKGDEDGGKIKARGKAKD